MDFKPRKQLWLEATLKKLYEKKRSFQTVKKEKKTPLQTPQINVINSVSKRRAEKSSEKHSSKKQKKPPKKNYDHSEKDEHPKHEEFWEFVDDFLHSNSFHPRSKKGFFNAVKIPTTVNYSYLKNIDLLTDEINTMDEKEAFAVKFFLKLQKARMRKSADIISREFLKGGM